MNGQEMLINAAMKALGITPEYVAQTIGDLQKIGGVARALDQKMDLILQQQSEILSLLRPTPDVSLNQIEDHSNGN